MNNAISRLQVSGTDLAPAVTDGPDSVSPVLVLNRSLKMTTGKAGSQAAHALMAYYLRLGYAEKKAWTGAGRPFSLLEADARQIGLVIPLDADSSCPERLVSLS